MDTLIAVPLLTAILQAIKTAGFPSRFVPLLGMIIGGIYTLGILGRFDFLTLLHGFVLGLSATGVYELVKKPVETGVEKIQKLI